MNTSVEVSELSGLPDDVIRFLESMSFGDGGLRYRRRQLAAGLAALPGKRFLVTRNNGKLTGSYLIVPTDIRLNGTTLRGYYRGLLAVRPDYRGRGYGRRLVDAALARVAPDGKQPTLAWGLIEKDNQASRRLLERAGARACGTLETRLIYRQWPKPSPLLSTLNDQQIQQIEHYRASLTDDTAGLSVSCPAALPAYGLIENGGIRAAARIGRAVLDLGEGGPLARFLHRYAYGRYGSLGRRYNRRAFTYLTVHDPWVSEQNAGHWESLLTALMAQTGTHMAAFTLDPRSGAHRLLIESGVLGSFARATRQQLKLYVNAWHVDHANLDSIGNYPVTGGPVI